MPHRLKSQFSNARLDQQLARQQYEQRHHQGHPHPALPVLPDRRRAPGGPAQTQAVRLPELPGNPEDAQDNREKLLRVRSDQEDHDRAAGSTKNAADRGERRREDQSLRNGQ